MKILVVYKDPFERDMFIRRLGMDPSDIEGTKNDKFGKYCIMSYFSLNRDPDVSNEKYKYVKFTYEETWSGLEINSVLDCYQKR